MAAADVKKDPEETSVNGGDSMNCLKELRDAVATMADSADVSDPMKALLGHFSTCVEEVSRKLDTLTDGVEKITGQLSSVSDATNSKLTELDDKITKIGSRMNISFGKQPGKTAPGTPDRKTKSGAVVPSTNESSKGVPIQDIAKNYPDLVLMVGTRDPWSYQFEFEFRVGDIGFRSLEQALFFIKYCFMKRRDLVVKVKKGQNTSEWNQVGQMATSTEWTDEALQKVCMTLLQLKCKQCKEFEDLVQEADLNRTYVQTGTNAVLAMGCPRSNVAAMLPDKFKGKNLFGVYMKDFVELHRAGLPDELPFDVNQYCKFQDLALPLEKRKFLVLGDVQMTGFKEKLDTKLIVDPTMSGMEHPKDESHTAKKILAGVEDLEDYGAVVLLFGTYEVGKSPDKLEGDYTALLKAVREMAPDAAIIIANALPRLDKFADQVKLTNYAIGIATRSIDDKNLMLFDLNEKFVSSVGANNVKGLLKPNGFHLNELGVEKMAEVLLNALPFVNLIPPKKTPTTPSNQGNRGGAAATSRLSRGGGPPAKRARRGSVGPTVLRGSYAGSMQRITSGMQYGASATPGYMQSPWSSRSAASGAYGMNTGAPSTNSVWPRYDY